MARHQPLYPDYCLQLLRDVERRTGRPLHIVTVDTAARSSPIVQIGVSGDVDHHVIYSSSDARSGLHYVTAAAHRILRLWEHPGTERLVADLYTFDALPQAWRDLFSESSDAVARAIGLRVDGPMLYEATGREILELPVDLRIEREIYETIPEHREHQLPVVASRIRQSAMVLGAPLTTHLPPALRHIVSAVHVAAHIECSNLIHLPHDLHEHPARPVADSLRAVLIEHSATLGIVGDRKVIDAWSRALEVTTWYEWCRIELDR